MHASQIQGCMLEQRVEKMKKIAESVWVHNVVTVRTGVVAGQCAMPYMPKWPVWKSEKQQRVTQCSAAYVWTDLYCSNTLKFIVTVCVEKFSWQNRKSVHKRTLNNYNVYRLQTLGLLAAGFHRLFHCSSRKSQSHQRQVSQLESIDSQLHSTLISDVLFIKQTLLAHSKAREK